MKSFFCPAPWYNLSTDVTGSLRPCCRFLQPDRQSENKMPRMSENTIDKLWNGQEFKILRQRFINNEQPKECEWCWIEENNNVRSYRQNLSDWHKPWWDNIDFTREEAPPPTSFDFRLTNVCNMKCRICSPQSSSLFLQEQESRGKHFKDKTYWLQNKILHTDNHDIFLSWIPHIQNIEVTGGEPLLSPENKLMLKTIYEMDESSHISLTISSNGKIFDEQFNDMLSKYKKVILNLSIDDINNRFEYQRFPSNWNKVSENIKKYYQLSKKHSNIKIYLYCTVSNLNVFYLDEYIDHFEQYITENVVNLHSFGMLHYNDWYSIIN